MEEKYNTLKLTELREIAKAAGVKNTSAMRKPEIVEVLCKLEEMQKTSEIQKNTTIKELSSEHHKDKVDLRPTDNVKMMEELDSGDIANGILEVMPDGFGFIRCENYLPGDNDVYVSPAQIRRFNLKTGDIVEGNLKIKGTTEKFSALLYVRKVNGLHPSEAVRRSNFEDMTPIFPNERIRLESERTSVPMRMVDLVSPIGKGQRGMIVSPPKTGKTTLLKQIAKSIHKNHPDMNMIILLIDERPEEVTDIKEYIEGDNVEVIYSTFDELPEHHKRVSEMVLERAKRLVEHEKGCCYFTGQYYKTCKSLQPDSAAERTYIVRRT